MKMDFEIAGLKCDNPNCDYVNSDIQFEQYEQYIDCPCPNCGKSLLTPQAYKMCVAMKSMGNFITQLTGGIKRKDSDEYKIPLDMDENGNIKLK